MALDFASPLTQLVTLLKSLSGLADEADGTSHVYTGIPESLRHTKSAAVALVDARTPDKATGLVQTEFSYLVVYAHRVAGDEAAAETSVAAWLAEFIETIYRPVNRKLTNTVQSLSLDFTLTGRPEYAPFSGQEYRQLLVTVRCVQYFNTAG